jgi:hypothetical protein
MRKILPELASKHPFFRSFEVQPSDGKVVMERPQQRESPELADN